MAEAIREGGVYKVGDEYQNANGEKVSKPKETAKEPSKDGEKPPGVAGAGDLAGINFASDEAAEAASSAKLAAGDFGDAKPSGAGGFTKADVTKLAAAKDDSAKDGK